jgi:aminoglycoside phosphotransferase family enzyme/predicted kinase
MPGNLREVQAMTATHQSAVLDAMQCPATYPHPVDGIRVCDTHISRVFLTGRWAYKVKKAVDFGFVDFSSLSRRRMFCQRELERNRQLTCGVYRDVVPISPHRRGYRIAGQGPPVEYAVRMRQLPEADTLSARLLRGAVDNRQINRLIHHLLAFYARSESVRPQAASTVWRSIAASCRHNFGPVAALADLSAERDILNRIRTTMEGRLHAQRDLFEARVREGHVRRLHGDLRCDHIYFDPDGSIQIIDCIEFNDRLCRIDTISDLSFLTMDLDHKGYPHFADLIMQVYVRLSGDAAGLALWPFYQCYRAMVRCKVHALRLQMPETIDPARRVHLLAARQYLHRAAAYAGLLEKPVILAMCGLPGAGKSTLARALARALSVPVYRSDIERRCDPAWPLAAKRYGTAARRRVYARLGDHARSALARKRSVILDATFDQATWRKQVRRLAAGRNADLVIVLCRASRETLASRLLAREMRPGASEARQRHLPTIQKRFEPPRPAHDVLELITDFPVERCLAEVLHRIARRPTSGGGGTNTGDGRPAKGGHHVQDHSGRHRPDNPVRYNGPGGSGLWPPIPVGRAYPPCD